MTIRLSKRDYEFLAKLQELVSQHVPFDARDGSNLTVGVSVQTLLSAWAERVRRFSAGARGGGLPSEDIGRLLEVDRRTHEWLHRTLLPLDGPGKLAEALYSDPDERAAWLDVFERMAALCRDWDEMPLSPFDSTPIPEVLSSAVVANLLREDLASLPRRISRLALLEGFGLDFDLTDKCRSYLQRVGDLYVSGFEAESVVLAASAIEEALEKLRESHLPESVNADAPALTLGELLHDLERRRLLSPGSLDAGWRIANERNDFLHAFPSCALADDRFARLIRDLAQVLAEASTRTT